jgi:N-acetylglucosamine-6-phosphate deacetylase
MTRTLVTGADLVLPDGVVSGCTLVVEDDRIADVVSGPRLAGRGETRVDRSGRIVVPGFIDVHVHGAAGIDVLAGAGSVEAVAAQLPRWGVTAFCPTTMACAPADLDAVLAEVGRLRAQPAGARARVLPAHLESNFLNPEYRGAQPRSCLRSPRRDAAPPAGAFTTDDVIAAIDRGRADIAIVTMAPELDGGVDLLRTFVDRGLRVSLGHSGATFEQAQAAAAAGASQATHLFNRMRPMTHREPGLAGAVLATEDIAAELVADGYHVHPAMMRVVVAAKGPGRVMAITDGTAGSGLPAGARAELGGQVITVGRVAELEDGTMAGSVLTMDRAFATLVGGCGLALPVAAALCATTPARELGLHGHGVLAAGAVADFVVLGSSLDVIETWIGGTVAWPAAPRGASGTSRAAGTS